MLARKGIEVHLATFLPEEYNHPNIIVHRLQRFFNHVRYVDFIFSAPKIKAVIRHINPDLLFCSVATTYGLGGALSGFKPLVVQTWSRDIAAPNSLNLREWVMVKSIGTYVLKRADGITTDGRAFREHLVQQLPSLAPKILATPWGIKVKNYRFNAMQKNQARQALDIPDVHTVLTSPRGIFWYYQPEIILPLLLKIARNRRDCTIVVLTLQHDRSAVIQKKLERLQEQSNIRVLDSFLELDEMQKVWAATDFFISCPKFDGVSETVQEGRAAGAIPILNPIASNLEQAKEGEHAFYVDPSDEFDRFYKQVNNILNTAEDKLIKMRQANRQWIDKYGDIDHTADRLVSFFKELINTRP